MGLKNNLYVRELFIDKKIPENNYLSKLPVVSYLQKKPITIKNPVTIFVGENGIGKSTLIEALAVAMGFNAEGGTVNFCFSTEDTHSDLYNYLRVAKGSVIQKDGFFCVPKVFIMLLQILSKWIEHRLLSHLL